MGNNISNGMKWTWNDNIEIENLSNGERKLETKKNIEGAQRHEPDTNCGEKWVKEHIYFGIHGMHAGHVNSHHINKYNLLMLLLTRYNILTHNSFFIYRRCRTILILIRWKCNHNKKNRIKIIHSVKKVTKLANKVYINDAKPLDFVSKTKKKRLAKSIHKPFK